MKRILLAGAAVTVVALLAVGAAFGLSSAENGANQADTGRTQDADHGRMPAYAGIEPSLAPSPDLKEIESKPPVSQGEEQRLPSSKPDTPVSSDGNSSSQPIAPDRPLPRQPGGGSQPYEPPVAPSGERQVVSAPIDGVDVLTLESFPPQYVVKVQAGLPSGCAQKHGHKVARQGNVITISVENTLPKEPVPCTMIYGMYEVTINLGSDFQSGVTYTVKVNDETKTFTAQ
jgi:hypothetical protein